MRFQLILGLLAIILSSSFLAKGGVTTAPPGPFRSSAQLSTGGFPGFFGMHTLSPNRHWPTVNFDIVRTAGTAWGYLEKSRGSFDWSGLDMWVSTAQAHGKAIIYTFLFTPQWASARPDEKCYRGNSGCAAPPENIADWDKYVSAVAHRYKGRICCYELWNEPNASGYFTGSYDDMVQMAQHAYRIIKSQDPAAIVVSPSPSSTGWPTPHDTWLDNYLRAGGGNYADVIAWHAYTSRSNQSTASPEDMLPQINKVRSIMSKYGLGQKPLWDTEGGWGKDSQLPDPDEQASFVARWLLLQFSDNVQCAFWYQWDNPNWGTLWDPAAGIRPAGQAYGEVYGWLKGASPTTACAQSHGVWTCNLIRNGKAMQAVWSLKGANYRVPAGFSQFRDLAGSATAIPSNATVRLGPKPILLQSK